MLRVLHLEDAGVFDHNALLEWNAKVYVLSEGVQIHLWMAKFQDRTIQ